MDQTTRPDWFREALGLAPEEHRVAVKGAEIELLCWGERGKPGLMFVHGMLAHARWWSFIAPFFANEFRCAALSFSGMGWSGWRDAYSMRIYADEILASIEAAGMGEGPAGAVVVAHSFGAFPARRLAEWQGQRLGGLVLLDSQVRNTAMYTPPVKEYTLRPYASVEEATARFRLAPPQPCENDFLVEHVAATGLRRQGAHWVRSFDPQIRPRLLLDDYHAGLGSTGCGVAFMHGDRSQVVNTQVKEYLRATYPDAPRVEIPQAGHHIMLDQPLALVSALRGLLSHWPAAAGRNAGL